MQGAITDICNSNAFIFPVVYFFYPETAYRSLEEIDSIFRKTTKGWRGWFDVVKTARNEPLRYGKHGELLVDYVNTDEHAERVGSVAHQGGVKGGEVRGIENGGVDGSGNGSQESSVLEKNAGQV